MSHRWSGNTTRARCAALVLAAVAAAPVAPARAASPKTPTYLYLYGPETGGYAGSTVPWVAILRRADGTRIVNGNTKIVFSLNHEANSEKVVYPDVVTNPGAYTAAFALADHPRGACCVDSYGGAPTRYVITARFDGDDTYAPASINAYQGYRAVAPSAAQPSPRVSIVVPQYYHSVPYGSDATFTAEYSENGVPKAGKVLLWDSMDLGQNGFYNSSGVWQKGMECTTGGDGRCSWTFRTTGRPQGSYGVTVMARDGVAVTDAATVFVYGAWPPQMAWNPGLNGWTWWVTHWGQSQDWTGYQHHGLYYHYRMDQIVNGWDSTNNKILLNTAELDNLLALKSAGGRSADLTQPVIISVGVISEDTASRPDRLGAGAYLSLGNYNGGRCPNKYAPPIHRANYKTRVWEVADAFAAWWANLPLDKQARVAGFVYGMGFHNEWLQPFTSPDCKEAFRQAVAAELGSVDVDRLIGEHKRLADESWGAAVKPIFSRVAVFSQGPAAEGASLVYPIHPKISVMNRPTGNAYQGNAPHEWGWVALGRGKNRVLACEDADDPVFAGGDTTIKTAAVSWYMVAQAAHMRCAEMNADGYPVYFTAFENWGTPVIPGLERLSDAVINAKRMEDRDIVAWWAHEAADGFKKGDPTTCGYQHSQGWNSDIYGDLDAGLVRRDVGAIPSAVNRDQLSARARDSFYIYPRPRPRLLSGSTCQDNPAPGSAGYSVRRGGEFYFDVHDGFARARQEEGRTLKLHLVVLNNKAASVLVEWRDASGIARSDSFSRVTVTPQGDMTDTWQEHVVTLTGIAWSDALDRARGVDVKVSGSDIYLTFAYVDAS